MTPQPTILFLCTGNSCRSQMAEGWAKSLFGNSVSVFSAGIEKHGLNPMAVEVMAEQGIDISSQTSQLITELPISEFDYVITVCDNANEHCPYFPAKTKVIHQSFDDPPKLAAHSITKEEALNHYRIVSLEIKEFIKAFIISEAL